MNWLRSIFLLLAILSCPLNQAFAQNNKEHIEVALRMVGHHLLLNSEDSSSRVLPIEQEDQKFRIRFESEFGFLPTNLVATIDSIIRITKIAERYRVEVVNVDSEQVVYSYESTQNTEVACGPRRQPKASYDLLFTILDRAQVDETSNLASEEKLSVDEGLPKSVKFLLLTITIILFIPVGIYIWNKRIRPQKKSNEILIGQYRFDQHNMKLKHKTNSIDLTSKETDLLSLLHSSMNKTLERDEILKVVWGDEGDYVGRTLDVFISKLRKKFSEDTNVKIVNVRGVGYKMMLSDSVNG